MDDRVRFYLDENVDPRIARALRRMDIDAISTVEANMRSLTDAAQWDYAKSQERVIVTSDDDFLKRAAEDSDHPGVIFFAKDTRSIGMVIDWLALIHNALAPDEMHGRIEFVPLR